MKSIFVYIIFISVIFLHSCGNSHNKPIECSFNLLDFEKEIRDLYVADSVTIQAIVIKEEVFFPTWRPIRICIYNPTTQTFDFKNFPEIHYGNENYSSIESLLTMEGLPIAQKIIKSCDVTEFNDMVIEYRKFYNDSNMLRYICHYDLLILDKKYNSHQD